MLKASLLIHILSASLWIGGMLFLVLILRPFLKTINDPKERANIYQIVGKGFRFWGWIAILLLLATGFLNLYFMGIPFNVLTNPEFHKGQFGRTLDIKLMLVFIIIASSFLHDFIIGPKAKSLDTFGVFARWLGRANLFIAILIVFFAVKLRLGGL